MYKEVRLGYNPMWRQQFSYVYINDNKGKKRFHKKNEKKERKRTEGQGDFEKTIIIFKNISLKYNNSKLFKNL